MLQLNMDSSTCVAGIFHNIQFDKNERRLIEEKFDKTILMLLDESAVISKLTVKCKTQQQADSVRKMIFALVNDIRTIIVKLADKLDRMRNLKTIDDEKQRKTAYEAINIWAPIANRLGISSVKDELEDLSLKFSNPDVFAHIKKIVSLKKKERDDYINKAVAQIEAEAKKADIEVVVKGRAKHFYSIYQKMRKRNKTADELFDLLAIRILCSTTVQCYTLVGLIHNLWKPLDGKFKDYIANPKNNGYQSLHTAVDCNGKPLEIQIRTFDMHETAENGVASHWIYKKGVTKDTVSASNLAVINKMKTLAKAATEDTTEDVLREFFAAIKAELLGNSVFVFTPRGDVVELPAGACAIDFAYAIHSAIGEKITGAKADGQIIALGTALKNTQTIEILTSPSARPTLKQLNLVKTTKARAKIRAYLNEHDPTYAASLKTEEASVLEQHIFAHHNHPQKSIVQKQFEDKALNTQRTMTAKIRIGDTSNFLFSLAGCCSPQFGDDVIGYISRGRGIIVHKENCRNVWRIPNIEERFVQIEWDTT
ncbi:MAG: bifunctional (p)ppGpp synthetase/guanosine-3',5'-bis(diphosphate) 3'-pyrophosphohydrolase [Treponema sp.]|nr:bifunctional (p)ppGpp synthetase/guanosine-3',5'-bis(diphosphate) 3'-pyrophosphohydrolase [Treponema sp.]